MNKRITSLVLVFVLVFAMSTTAFAAPITGTAMIQFVVFEEDYGTFEIASGVSLYDAIVVNFGDDNATYGDLLPGWDYDNDYFWPSVPAYFMNTFLMCDNEFVDFYYDIVTGEYVSESYSWKYSVNNSVPVFDPVETPTGESYFPNHEKAMNQYIIQNDDFIVLDYELWIERF